MDARQNTGLAIAIKSECDRTKTAANRLSFFLIDSGFDKAKTGLDLTKPVVTPYCLLHRLVLIRDWMSANNKRIRPYTEFYQSGMKR